MTKKTQWLIIGGVLAAVLLIGIGIFVLHVRATIREYLVFGQYSRVFDAMQYDDLTLPSSIDELHQIAKQLDVTPFTLPPGEPWGDPEYRPIPVHFDPNQPFVILVCPRSHQWLCYTRMIYRASRNLRKRSIESVPYWNVADVVQADDELRESIDNMDKGKSD